MKRILAVIMLGLLALCMLTGCQKEADMVESMVSTMIPTTSDDTDKTEHNSGSVTDGDGIIGNDDREEESSSSKGSDTTTTTTENLV